MKTTRRAFLRLLGIGVTVPAVLPKVLPALLPATGGIVAEPVHVIHDGTLFQVSISHELFEDHEPVETQIQRALVRGREERDRQLERDMIG